MKTYKLYLASFAIGSLLAILFSCGPTRPTILKPNMAYAKYVAGYTSGMISRQGTIKIELADFIDEDTKLKENKLPDSTLLDGIFSFEPEIKGKAVWSDARTIEFIPDEPLASNQFYNAEFDLERLMTVADGLESFPFQFASYQQKIYVETYSLQNFSEYNIEWQQLKGKMTISDYEDLTLLKKVLKATQDGKELPITINPNEYDDNEYYFVVDSIQRKKNEGKVILTWNGEPINSMSKGKKVTEVGALGDFTVETAKVIEDEDQSVEISFGQPIDISLNLKGIISLEGVDNLTYKIDVNTVTVYLPNRFEGKKRLNVSTGIKNFKGYNMLKEYETDLYFNSAKPQIRLKGSGSILPNSQGLIFPFEAISLKSVNVRIVKIFENNVHHFLQVNDLNGEDGLTRYGKIIVKKRIQLDYDKSMNMKQWNKHVIDLGKLIHPDPGAIYRVSLKFEREDAICECEESQNEKQNENDEEDEEDENWSENYWGAYDFDDGFDSWYNYSEEESPCSGDYYYGKALSRNILGSDIGMVYKLDEDKMTHAFVSNMITTEPLANALVQYVDYTKQIIASGKTDANGMLDLKLKEKPFLMVVSNGKQKGYMKLGDGYSNSLSKFDIEGERVKKGVKGYIYGERGVWRPGDSLYLAFILENKDHLLPDNHPVKFELQDPNGQIIQQMTKSKHVHGIFDFRTMVNNEAPTGNYTAVVSVGNRTYTKNVKIETVKPNRLKIYMDIDKVQAQDSFAQLKVKWLHGATAKNLNANVEVTYQKATTVFDNYQSYIFDSPIRYFTMNTEQIYDGSLNDKGEAKIPTKLNVGQSSPGMLRAVYTTKVFEKSGNFSIDRCMKIYSPYSSYVGLKIPKDGYVDNLLESGKRYNLNLVSLNPNGSLKKTTTKMQVRVYRLEWRWWYEQDYEDIADFVSRNGTLLTQDTVITTTDGTSSFPFKVKYPDYGRFLITVTDLDGNHQTGQVVTVDWPNFSRSNRSTNDNANMLNFSADKETYTTGQKVKLSIPSPANGKALISVETRSKVIKKYWINTVKGETTHEFTATKDMAPNAYIHVTLLQPHLNTKNDLPIRMYGIIPVKVDDPATHLHPIISMKDEVRPESVATIRINEQQGKAMTYTLAIVDEGLLDLTRFQTPEPWNTFYAKEALGVKTWDMYDDVIGAYAGKLDRLLSVGGDGELNLGKGNKASRFKPMVKFVGVFHVGAGESKTHKVDIPNYIGSVRVMVVAREEAAYGSTEKAVAVKKPLMVLGTLPRVVGPKESVSMPVDVFAMEKFVKDVNVQIEVNELFTLDGSNKQSLHFDEIGDDILNFKLKVASKIGIGKVKITATCGNERSIDEIEIDVRASNPIEYTTADFVLESGKEGKCAIDFNGIGGTNQTTIEFSTLPSFGLEKRLDYLIQYPHGCIEQTTSSVFPQLFVASLTDADSKQQKKISENIKAGIKRIQLFQTSSGGFSYWPGEGSDNEWGTNYAGHFLFQAERRGYTIPENLKQKWINYQQEQAKNWSRTNNPFVHAHGNESYELTQAYRLYVLALSNHPELSAMNRLREERGLSASAKWRLAAAYEIAGQHEVATKLVSGLPTAVKSYRELSYSYGSDFRDNAMILETMSLLNKKQQAYKQLMEICEALGSDKWMSTQETAYGLLAVCEYAGLKETGASISYSYKLEGGSSIEKTISKQMTQVRIGESDVKAKSKVYFKNKGKSTLFVKVITEGIPFNGKEKTFAKGLTMSVHYKDMSGNTIQPDHLKQGTEFLAEVTICNTQNKIYKEMALTQIFPSGWEIHNDRMGDVSENAATRYQDIRDDRVLSYYDLKPYEAKTIIIKLNATYLGRFYLPAVYSEAMYDHWICAQVPGKWVEVVKEKQTGKKSA